MSDPTKRLKTVNGGGTSWSIAFNESTPLDNTHLLIAAIVKNGSSANPQLPAGWTEIKYYGNASCACDIFAKRGDGVTNSVGGGFTGLGTVNNYTAFLLAFAGFVTITPTLAPTGVDQFGQSSQYLELSGSAQTGVALTLVGVSADATSATMSGGFVDKTAYPAVGMLGVRDYPGATVGNFTDWAGPTSSVGVQVFIPVNTPPAITKSYAKGSVPVTLAKGATKVEGQKG